MFEFVGVGVGIEIVETEEKFFEVIMADVIGELLSITSLVVDVEGGLQNLFRQSWLSFNLACTSLKGA